MKRAGCGISRSNKRIKTEKTEKKEIDDSYFSYLPAEMIDIIKKQLEPPWLFTFEIALGCKYRKPQSGEVGKTVRHWAHWIVPYGENIIDYFVNRHIISKFDAAKYACYYGLINLFDKYKEEKYYNAYYKLAMFGKQIDMLNYLITLNVICDLIPLLDSVVFLDDLNIYRWTKSAGVTIHYIDKLIWSRIPKYGSINLYKQLSTLPNINNIVNAEDSVKNIIMTHADLPLWQATDYHEPYSTIAQNKVDYIFKRKVELINYIGIKDEAFLYNSIHPNSTNSNIILYIIKRNNILPTEHQLINWLRYGKMGGDDLWFFLLSNMTISARIENFLFRRSIINGLIKTARFLYDKTQRKINFMDFKHDTDLSIETLISIQYKLTFVDCYYILKHNRLYTILGAEKLIKYYCSIEEKEKRIIFCSNLLYLLFLRFPYHDKHIFLHIIDFMGGIDREVMLKLVMDLVQTPNELLKSIVTYLLNLILVEETYNKMVVSGVKVNNTLKSFQSILFTTLLNRKVSGSINHPTGYRIIDSCINIIEEKYKLYNITFTSKQITHFILNDTPPILFNLKPCNCSKIAKAVEWM